MSILGEGGSAGGDGGNGGSAGAGAAGGAGAGGQGSAGGQAGSQGGGGTSWRDSLPEDIKGNAALANFGDVGALAKSYLHAQSMVGKKGVVVPGQNASDEEWASFYKGIGQPDPDKFEIQAPKEHKVDEAFMKEFKENAHKSGLLPKQAQKLLDWYVGKESAALKAHNDAQALAIKEGIDGLKKEWGEGYAKELSAGEAAVHELGGEEFGEFLVKSGLNKNATMIKFLNKAGKLLGEDKIRGEGGGHFGQTPSEIQAEIAKIMGDPKHPYFHANHPGHKVAMAQMEDLFKKQSQAGQRSA